MITLWSVYVAVAVMLMACACALAVEPIPARALYREPHRPQFHFTPPTNWMNDPNGLVFFEGEYHLFYQWNPLGDTWGHMSWGHAVSSDMLHWKHLPLALAEDEGIMMFSGSAVADHKNSTGFGKFDQPALVAIYTGHTDNKQTQNIAYSRDKGRTWTKYVGNPVIDEQLKDFRDPKVFWHEPTQRWIMVVSVSDQRKVRLYDSGNLQSWTLLSEFGGEGALRGIWECPDLFELRIENTQMKRWVLIVNSGDEAPGGGGGTQYFIGSFNGKAFRNDNPREKQLWADSGSDFFAAQSWSDMPDGRRVWLAWMSNWRYAAAEPTKPWRCAQTLPRELKLRRTSDGLRIAQTPIAEAQALRGERVSENQFADAGQVLEINATIKADSDAAITVCGDADGGAVIGYDAAKREVYVDRSKASPQFHKDFTPRHAAKLSASDAAETRLQIFVDQSSVEVFADDGVAVITDRIFPSPKNHRLSGTGPVALEVWKLKPVWNDGEATR